MVAYQKLIDRRHDKMFQKKSLIFLMLMQPLKTSVQTTSSMVTERKPVHCYVLSKS